MDKAWNFIWNNFFDSKTNLLYDYLVKDCDKAATDHLPSTDEINRQIPNACGWGTGMEDSMLSAGSLLDALVARYNVTADQSIKAFADKLFRGMMLCVKDGGFLARSVSPIDSESFYYDTSRDQYTHWIYGALRLYSSALCDLSQKQDIKRVLCSFAKRAEQNVTQENDFNLLRYDGKVSLVAKMWGDLGAHEYLRLPFIYAAAWYVTGDEHWYEIYMKYRDEGFEKTLDFNACAYGNRCYPVLQMQYSLRALYDIDPDENFKKKCYDLMHKVAKSYVSFAPSESARLCQNQGAEELYYQYKPWNKVKMQYLGVIGDRAYFNPAQSELKENRGFYHIRNVGEAVSILALCPKFKIGEEQFTALQNLCDAIDYERHCSYAPMLLFCGYWLAKETNI